MLLFSQGLPKYLRCRLRETDIEGSQYHHKGSDVAPRHRLLEWIGLISANRLGNRVLSAAQVSLSSFVFDFLGQIVSNRYWLKLPTTLDDYIGMGIILAAMGISTYKVFG
jgi:hypothetical protein